MYPSYALLRTCMSSKRLRGHNRELVAPYVLRPLSRLREQALQSCPSLNTPLHTVPFDVRCILTICFVPRIAVQSVRRLPNKKTKRYLHRQSKHSLVKNHRGMPTSRPPSLKHSQVANDTRRPRFEPAPLPVVLVPAVVEAQVGLPPWLI